jgi:hypothetical protein
VIVGRSLDRARVAARWIAATALVVVPSLPSPAPVRALDVEIDSDASFQVYEVRAPGTSTVLARRRFTSNLGLRLVEPVGEPYGADGRRVRLSLGMRLRLHHDFGSDCLVGRELCVRASAERTLGSWQPLSSGEIVDLPMAWLAVDQLPLGASARLGRQLESDPIGFVRFDGISLRISPASFVAIDGLFGLMVRGTSVLGTPQFEPQGTMRVDRAAVDPLLQPWTDLPAETWVAGARIHGGPGEALQLGASFRQAWDPSGVVVRRLGLSAASQPLEIVRLQAQGVVDLLDVAIIDALASIELREDAWSARLSYERQVPRFDPGSIWGWFRLAPIDQARLGGSWRVSDDVELAGAVRARRAELGPAGDGQAREDWDAGIEGSLAAKIERIDTRITGFAWSGALGPVAGVSIDASRRLVREVGIGLHVSAWHFDDPLRSDLYGAVISESIDGVFDVTSEASIVLELTHATSRVVGHRFRGIVWLRVETWR